MTWLDYTVIAVLVVSIAWGIWRGLVHEVLSLVGWSLLMVSAGPEDGDRPRSCPHHNLPHNLRASSTSTLT